MTGGQPHEYFIALMMGQRCKWLDGVNIPRSMTFGRWTSNAGAERWEHPTSFLAFIILFILTFILLLLR
ncbi:unnamed protein product [Gongylonema pulchrum]|uniref:Transmembrane protein n=1 Tax=Gongylonema pulchrum TaxID=637853 RepID=A0A183D8U1_9BILA|nr:unnamed protein product [Gongylonema pulchrum]